MSLRRLVAASAAALTSLALLNAPATAAPDRTAGSADSAADSRATVTCSTLTWGVTTGNRIIRRTLRNNSLAEPDVLLAKKLPFRPTALATKSVTRDGDKWTHEYVTLNSDRKPRVVTVRGNDSTGPSGWSSRPLLNSGFRQRLLTDGGGFNYFMVDSRGDLRRWILYRNDRGQLYFGGSQLVKSGMGNLKTLSGMLPQKIGGVWNAVLLGTSRTGALIHIRVGDVAPRRSDDRVGKVRVVTLKRSGFARYNAASPGWCNLNPAFGSLTLIDSKGDRAQLVTLKGLANPKAGNFANRGRVGRNVHWRIRAAL